MNIRKKLGWELPESAATPEHVFANRRRLLKAIGAGSLVLAAPAMLRPTETVGKDESTAAAEASDPSAFLYPVRRNSRYELDRPLTAEEYAIGYNNYYEFGSHKQISGAAQSLPVRPWQVRIEGMVETPFTIDIDDLLKRMPLEERLYLHRCVEAWSMAVPWSGFLMKALVDLAEPLSGARYVHMETFYDPEVAPGQKQSWYPWPYV